jgi:hypothetical protein
MIAGIVGLFFAIIPGVSVLGILVSIAALVLGILGLLAKGRRHGKALSGIILGAIGLLVAISVTAASASGSSEGFKLAQADQSAPSSSAVPSATPNATKSASPIQSATPAQPAAPTKPAAPASPYGIYPAVEAQFVQTVEATAKAFNSGSTDLQQSQAIRTRDAQLCSISGSHAESWVGTIHDIGATGDGFAYVNVEIAPTIVLQTWNNAFSDIDSDTLIKPDQPFFQTLVPMKEGQKVTFSGDFLSSSDSCLKRANLTETFYATDPNFILKFTNIAAQ